MNCIVQEKVSSRTAKIHYGQGFRQRKKTKAIRNSYDNVVSVFATSCVCAVLLRPKLTAMPTTKDRSLESRIQEST